MTRGACGSLSEMGKQANSFRVLFVLCALVVTGCGGTKDTVVSSDCTRAFDVLDQVTEAMYAAEAAGKTFTEDQWNSVDAEPLFACSTADEWLAAGKANPGALGYTHEDAIDETMLGVYCYGQDVVEAPVCIDAAAQGIEAP